MLERIKNFVGWRRLLEIPLFILIGVLISELMEVYCPMHIDSIFKIIVYVEIFIIIPLLVYLGYIIIKK